MQRKLPINSFGKSGRCILELLAVTLYVEACWGRRCTISGIHKSELACRPLLVQQKMRSALSQLHGQKEPYLSGPQWRTASKVPRAPTPWNWNSCQAHSCHRPRGRGKTLGFKEITHLWCYIEWYSFMLENHSA